MGSIEVRRAGAADADQLYELALEFGTSFRPERAAFDASFVGLRDQGDTLLIVGADGDRLVGYLLAFVHDTFFANGPVCWIEELMVTEEAQRSGAGRAMVADRNGGPSGVERA